MFHVCAEHSLPGGIETKITKSGDLAELTNRDKFQFHWSRHFSFTGVENRMFPWESQVVLNIACTAVQFVINNCGSACVFTCNRPTHNTHRVRRSVRWPLGVRPTQLSPSVSLYFYIEVLHASSAPQILTTCV
jgi:hypothetical protein